MTPLGHFDTFRFAFDAAHAAIDTETIEESNRPALLWAALNAAHHYLATPAPDADKARAWQVAAWALRQLYGPDAARAAAAFVGFAPYLSALDAVGATLADVPNPALRAPALPEPLAPLTPEPPPPPLPPPPPE